MAHLVETMAYHKAEVPWHGLGTPVEGDLTPEQMLKEAGLDWQVSTVPAFIELNGQKIEINKQALIRSTDNKILTIVSDNWKPLQNATAFEFFNDLVVTGKMNMETAGSLCGGELVWALARINDGFSLFNGKDEVNAYMLFTNPHRYGTSISVANINTRVVCNNTLRMAMNEFNSDNVVKVGHRREFVADQVKVMLGIAKEKLNSYKEAAKFLSSKKANNENIVDYFKRVFPIMSKKEDKETEMSRPAKKVMELLDTQPGAEFGKGTFWQPFNAVTYYIDHEAGRAQDTRLTSAWYGSGAKKKIEALKTAIEMAEAA